jgi:multiple sugar transport system substrate-binding protein
MKKSFFTKLLIFLVVVSMVLSIAGCTKKEKVDQKEEDQTKATTTQDEAKKDDTPKDVKVYFSGWTSNNKMARLIERWEKLRSDLKIDYVDLAAPNDIERIQKYDTLVASGERIDLFYGYPFETMLRAVNGAVLPMDEYIKELGHDLTADYGPEIEILKYKGKTYGVPYITNTFKLFYNKDWFKEKNVTIPENLTLDQMADIARKFVDHEKEISGLSYPFTWEDLVYAPAVQAGWKMVVEKDGKAVPNFDDPIFRKNMEFMYNISTVEKLCPDIARQKSEKLNRRIYFYEKKAPMLVDGWYTLVHLNMYRFDTEGAKPVDFEIGVMDMPRFDENSSTEVTQAELYSAFMIPKTAKNPKGAYEFARFLSTENIDLLGGIPAYKKADLSDAIKPILNFTTKAGVEHKDVYPEKLVRDTLTVTKQGHLIYYNHDPLLYAKYYPSLMQVFNQQYDMYLTGQVSIDDFIKILQDRGADEIRKVDSM